MEKFLHEIGCTEETKSVIDQSSWPPSSIEIDERSDKELRQDFIGPLLQRVGWRAVRTSNRPFLAPLGGASVFLIWGEGGVGTGVSLERWLKCFAHPFGGVECKGHVCSTLL